MSVDAWFIVGLTGGIVLNLLAVVVFPRFLRKSFASTSERVLLEMKINARYGFWSAMVAQILVGIGLLAAFAHDESRRQLGALLIFAFLFCQTCRAIFRSLRTTAEVELEARNLKEKQV
jgi:hypothetical protein